MENDLTLIEKLAKIRAMSDVVAKNQSGYKFRYADISSILAKVTAGMKKYKVSLIPTIVPGTIKTEKLEINNTQTTKTGSAFNKLTTEMLVSAEMVFKWVNDENEEDVIEVPWVLVGSQADPSQAFGSALTYCTRYFLCNYFQIATPENDVDVYRSEQKRASDEEDRMVTGEIIKKIDTLVTNKLVGADENNKKEIVAFIGNYAKNSNYKAITNPDLAAKLLKDLIEKYGEDDK